MKFTEENLFRGGGGVAAALADLASQRGHMTNDRVRLAHTWACLDLTSWPFWALARASVGLRHPSGVIALILQKHSVESYHACWLKPNQTQTF